MVYCYGVYLPDTFALLKKQYPQIKLIEGISGNLKFDRNLINVLIIDDLMVNANKSSIISDYFTKGSHHLNLSVFLLTQNFFQKGEFSRTISLNAHYIFLFNNPRDKRQVESLAQQMFPKQTKILTEAYFDSIERNPFGYLLIDLKQSTPTCLRLRTNILPTDREQLIIYVPTI